MSLSMEETSIQGETKSTETRKIEVESILISDLHLGTKDSKALECKQFLNMYQFRKLILVGDIIDAWALKRGAAWQPAHTRFVRSLLKKIEKEVCEVYYLRGNHDDIAAHIMPIALGCLHIQQEYALEGKDGRHYLCIHGDGFDSISTNHRCVAELGSACYDALLWLNRLYNRYRRWRGLDYYSLSQAVKGKVKKAVQFFDAYEKQLTALASRRGFDGIIAGHIHHPADHMIGNGRFRYLNCGDWVETMSAVIEHTDGRIEIVGFHPSLGVFPLKSGKEKRVSGRRPAMPGQNNSI